MPTLTPDQLSAMQFGYLNGADLVQWCSPMLLIKQYEVNNQSLNNGVIMAYSEAINSFLTKYDVKKELGMVSGPRELTFVKILSIMAVRNILGNMAGIGEVTKGHYDWCDERIHMIQAGTFNLQLDEAPISTVSGAFLVPQNFSTLG